VPAGRAAHRAAIPKLGIEAEAIGRRQHRGRTVRVPVFRDLDRRRIRRAHGLRQVLADVAPAIVLDHPHLVVADPVDSVLAQEEPGIVDQELRDPLVPIGEDLAAAQP
jgi:hypothetical protein